MPACSICTHPDHDAIEARLVEGASLRGLARAYRVSASSLRRHRDAGHLPRVKVDEAEKREAVRAADLLARAGRYESVAASIVAAALQGAEQDPRLALQAIDRALAALVAQARLIPDRAADQEIRVTFAAPLPASTPPPVVDEDDLPRLGERGNGRR